MRAASDELLLEAMTCLVESQKKKIKELEFELETSNQSKGFLLDLVARSESRGWFIEQIKENKEQPFKLPQKVVDDFINYFECC